MIIVDEMIKEKHEKGPDNVKEEAGSSEKESTNPDVSRIKKEDDATGSNCAIKKEPGRPVTKNGNIIGSTNTGSLPEGRKTDGDDGGGSGGDGANLPLKSEECIEGELGGDAFAFGGAPPHPTPPDGVQPLASNVIGKQSGSMEVQYMQQQSQIFVFSTVLANTGADEVLQGHYPSIIAYHCAQPGTKKYLEKNPLKVTQFNRQNPAQWLNNLAMMKNKGCTRSPGLSAKNQPPTIDNFLGPDGLDDMVGLADSDIPWNQKNNHHLEGLEGVSNGLPDVVPDMDACSPSLANVQPSLQGVKVPDENLTPQQRQHREEQLATIRKMQQMLFPESQAIDGGGSGGGNPSIDLSHCAGPQQQTPNVPTSSSHLEWFKMQQQQRQFADDPKLKNMPPTSGSCGSGGGNVPIGPISSATSTTASRSGNGGNNNNNNNNNSNNSISSTTTNNNNNNNNNSNTGGQRLQGPPPPYHQTPRSASVPIALQSPSPASPNNPTSNLSLPSPRASSSALNSPAEQNRQFVGLGRHNNNNNNNNNNNISSSSSSSSSSGTTTSMTTGPMPQSATATGHSPTSQDSPTTQRLNHSNPGTPVSSHMSPNVNNNNNSNSNNNEPISTHQSSVDGMFGRTLQSIAQQQKHLNTSTSCSATLTPSGKEPNLMPVPSPQQIQYLNTFEGQELIIQKQPNTSLKERNIISPPILSSTLDNSFAGNTSDLSHSRMSGPNTPTSLDVGSRFPPTPGVPSDGCRFQIPSPHTPTAADKQRLTGSGPTSTPGLSPQTASGPTSDPLKSDLFPTPSPHMMDVARFPGPNASPGAKMGGGAGSGGSGGGGGGGGGGSGGFVNVSPSGSVVGGNNGVGVTTAISGGKSNPLEMSNYGCVRGDNVPLNPNCTSTMACVNAKVSHFDPISSLAQMSQQLTNSVASSLNGQGGGNQGPGGMMNFGSPTMHHMMDLGGCHGISDLDQNPSNLMGMSGMQGPPHGFHPNSPMGGQIRSLSPKLPGAFPNHMPMPRMMGRPPGPNPYNGANVQVKPNAPNTIQYLPAKSQIGNAPGPPRGPPSLDFLQRFANPLGNMDSKMPTQNLQYFPNCSGPPPPHPSNNGPMQGPGGPPMPHHMGHMVDGNMQPDGPMGGMMGGGPLGNGGGNNGGPMMGGGGNMGMPGNMIPMMRGGPMRPPPTMMRMPQMGFNGPGPGGVDSMFNPGPNLGNPNAQMFVTGPKGSPMGMGGGGGSVVGGGGGGGGVGIVPSGPGGAPDASQPLPPSMGQNNSFKNSPFVGPTTADPNYAQQYHNFQQQLYATGTRSQMGGGAGGGVGQAMGPGPGPGPPHTQQPSYFNPK